MRLGRRTTARRIRKSRLLEGPDGASNEGAHGDEDIVAGPAAVMGAAKPHVGEHKEDKVRVKQGRADIVITRPRTVVETIGSLGAVLISVIHLILAPGATKTPHQETEGARLLVIMTK